MKEKLFYTFLPLASGSIVGLLVKANLDGVILPPFMPPKWIFPVVWTSLYLLMGYSYNMIRNDLDKKTKIVFFSQLILNLGWTIIFFKFRLFFLSVIWIFFLILLVNLMLILFYDYNKKATYLNLPYFIWLLIAYYLTVGVYLFNIH